MTKKRKKQRKIDSAHKAEQQLICWRKQVYHTEDEAIQYAKLTKACRPGMNLEPYYCCHCHRYHLRTK